MTASGIMKKVSMMKIKTIKMKIALAAGVCLVATAGILVGYSVYSATSSQTLVSTQVTKLIKETTLKKLESTAADNSKVITSQIEEGLNAANILALSMSAIRQSDDKSQIDSLDRQAFNDVLLSVLKSNTGLNGTYSAWEPNAFDEKDSQNINMNNGSNPQTGRFTPYWTRDPSGRIQVQHLVEYDSTEKHPNGIAKGAWYQVPKKTLKETVTAPLPYIVQGKAVWLATLSAPIIVNGEFKAVVGTDFNLDFVQNLVKEVSDQLYSGHSRVTIVTDTGLVVADSQAADLIGDSIKKVYGDEASLVIDLIKAGDLYTFEDPVSNSFRVLVPITFAESGIYWGITIQVDQDIVLQDVTQLNQVMTTKSRESITYQMLIGLVILVSAVGALWIIATRITQPILSSVNMAKEIAKGKFDIRVDNKSQDEVGQLSNALNDMAEALHRQVNVAERIADGDLTAEVILASDDDQLGSALKTMVDDLNELVSQIKERAQEIGLHAHSVDELSSELAGGATQSASSVTEISATITQMVAQIQQTSENADEASRLAKRSFDSATDGDELMGELRIAMRDIEASGQDINNIISTIEEIAEQTNLLALNAAIEAARAGEFGRGFAVVADEVRKLAARSADAVKETSRLISSSADKTKRGLELSTQTSESLSLIVENVGQVTNLMTEIAQASAEQSTGAQQVSLGINQIDEVVHHNSKNSEQCAQASSQLMSQSSTLTNLIGQFKLR